MAIGFGRTATQDLTHIGLVLAPRRARGRRVVPGVMLVAALAVSAGLGYAVRSQLPSAPLPQTAAPATETHDLHDRLEQALLAQRLSDARSGELERQIDDLNQRLRASQEELTFFRQARPGKH